MNFAVVDMPVLTSDFQRQNQNNGDSEVGMIIMGIV